MGFDTLITAIDGYEFKSASCSRMLLSVKGEKSTLPTMHCVNTEQRWEHVEKNNGHVHPVHNCYDFERPYLIQWEQKDSVMPQPDELQGTSLCIQQVSPIAITQQVSVTDYNSQRISCDRMNLKQNYFVAVTLETEGWL